MNPFLDISPNLNMYIIERLDIQSYNNIDAPPTLDGEVKGICECPCGIIAVGSILQLFQVEWLYPKVNLLHAQVLCTSL